MSAPPLDLHGNVDGPQNGAEKSARAPAAGSPMRESVRRIRRAGDDAFHRRPSVVLPVGLKIGRFFGAEEMRHIVSAPIEEELDRLPWRTTDEAVPIEEFECPDRIARRQRTV